MPRQSSSRPAAASRDGTHCSATGRVDVEYVMEFVASGVDSDPIKLCRLLLCADHSTYENVLAHSLLLLQGAEASLYVRWGRSRNDRVSGTSWYALRVADVEVEIGRAERLFAMVLNRGLQSASRADGPTAQRGDAPAGGGAVGAAADVRGFVCLFNKTLVELVHALVAASLVVVGNASTAICDRMRTLQNDIRASKAMYLACPSEYGLCLIGAYKSELSAIGKQLCLVDAVFGGLDRRLDDVCKIAERPCWPACACGADVCGQRRAAAPRPGDI